jgi:hypothetical protein
MDLIKNCHGCVRLRADPKRADRFPFTPKFGCDAPRRTRSQFMRPCPHFERWDPPEAPAAPCYEAMFEKCTTSLCAAPELPPQES